MFDILKKFYNDNLNIFNTNVKVVELFGKRKAQKKLKYTLRLKHQLSPLNKPSLFRKILSR